MVGRVRSHLTLELTQGQLTVDKFNWKDLDIWEYDLLPVG